MTFGTYGIAMPSGFNLSDEEILAEVYEAFQKDELVKQVADDFLSFLAAGNSMSPTGWRNLLSVMHSSRRDCGTVPRWSSVGKGIWIQQRIIELATDSRC